MAIALAGAMAAGGITIIGADTAQANQGKKTEAIVMAPEVAKPVSVRNVFGGYSGGGTGNPSRFLNQRQYRKKCRQNNNLYKSKKHRSKN